MPGPQKFAVNEPHLSACPEDAAGEKARNFIYTKKREPCSSRRVLSSFFAE